MSAIAGVFARSGERIDPQVVQELSSALQRIGPDGEFIDTSHPVSMVYRPLYADRISRHDTQPLVTDDGCMVTWDGRLDNADEIRAMLDVRGGRWLETPRLVLAAYRTWGTAAFARLIGDFALAIWQPAERQLVLCADAIGIRSLSYQITDHWCLWATTARAILRASDQPAVPDPEYLASFLVNQPSPGSAFKGIDLLPGGHALIVTPTDARLERYWAIDPSHRIEHRSDEDYEAHFRDVFQTAVACRMRTAPPVFCELSGGVDSTAIACVADRLHRAAPDEVAELRTISYVFPRARSSDETPFIRLVESHLGATGLHIADDDAEMLASLDPSTLDSDFPTNQLCFLQRHNRAAAAMNAIGSHVLLSGLGGDQMFWSDPPEALPLADLVVERRWRALARATREWSYALSWPYAKTLWRGACWPLLPHRVKTLFWRPEAHAVPFADWIDPGFVRRMRIKERAMVIQPDDLGFRLPSASVHYGVLRQTVRQHALGLYTTEGSVDMRYPFLDRRVVEFALATPIDQKVRPGETRSIMRRALKDLVPDQIRRRRSKCGPTEAFYRALNRQWPWVATLLADLRVCAHGVAAREPLVTAFHQARHGRVTSSTQLLRALSLEIWLRSLETTGRGASSVAA